MDALKVGDSLFMQKAIFDESVDITYAEIASVLVLPGDYDATLDLTGTRVGNELRLGPRIGGGDLENSDSELILRNVIVDALQDRHETWPPVLEMDGFRYDRLGGYVDMSAGSEMTSRPSEWFIHEWLAKDESYTSQPYKQLAQVLRTAGLETKAKEVLYAGKERERSNARGLRRFVLILLNLTIGYGYRYSHTMICVVMLVIVGALVLKITGEGKRNKMPYGFAYSLDLLLPIVALRSYHYEAVHLKLFARYYFYFHMLMGYVLASFLIAGLSGLTK